jgi:structural maintenance of chromosome 1
VVVDTKQTASDCIQWLRSNQIGTATFLPLDTLQVPSSDSTERIRAMVEQDSRYRLAYDVIACDESVKKAVLYAVGNSVVSDDLDCARELCFSSQNKRRRNDEARIKAVTLGGAVISKAGTMTGGVSNEDRSRAGRWDDREVQKLRSRKEELENQLAELDNDNQGNAHGDRRASRGGHNYKIEELRNLVGNLTNRLQYSQSDLEFTTKKVKEQEVLITSIASQVKKGERQLEETEGQLEAAGVNAQKAADEVKQLEEEHYTPFLEKTGMQDFHAYGEAVGKAREDYFKKVRIIRQHLEKLKAQKIYEEGRDTDSAMKKKTKTLENIRKKLENAQIREGKISNSVAKAKAKLADIESKLEQAREEETEHEEKVRDAQKDYKSSQQDVAKLNKNLSNEEANLDRLRAKQHETLQTARVEEAELPQTDESNAETSTQVSNKLDYSSLRRDLKQRRSDRDFNKMQKKFQENLEKMTTQIEVMAPNMKVSFE